MISFLFFTAAALSGCGFSSVGSESYGLLSGTAKLRLTLLLENTGHWIVRPMREWDIGGSYRQSWGDVARHVSVKTAPALLMRERKRDFARGPVDFSGACEISVRADRGALGAGDAMWSAIQSDDSPRS